MHTETPRSYLITGSASGMGAATARLLVERGARVIGVDLHDAEICADLSTASGRELMLEEVRAMIGQSLDAVIACAGLPGGRVDSDAEMIVRVNYFGALATLHGLRPLLVAGNSPRAVAVSSLAAILDPNEALLEACLAADESTALAVGERDSLRAYRSTKRALALWVRRAAPTPDWAGAGIALNAVAPGVIATPLTATWLNDPGAREQMLAAYPQPLARDGVGQAEQVARVLAWLTSAENELLCGQVIYVDGGYEALTRGSAIF